MKTYVVIKQMPNINSGTLAAMFDDINDAATYARLSHMNDEEHRYSVYSLMDTY